MRRGGPHAFLVWSKGGDDGRLRARTGDLNRERLAGSGFSLGDGSVDGLGVDGARNRPEACQAPLTWPTGDLLSCGRVARQLAAARWRRQGRAGGSSTHAPTHPHANLLPAAVRPRVAKGARAYQARMREWRPEQNRAERNKQQAKREGKVSCMQRMHEPPLPTSLPPGPGKGNERTEPGTGTGTKQAHSAPGLWLRAHAADKRVVPWGSLMQTIRGGRGNVAGGVCVW